MNFCNCLNIEFERIILEFKGALKRQYNSSEPNVYLKINIQYTLTIRRSSEMIKDGFVYIVTLIFIASILVCLPSIFKGKTTKRIFDFAPSIVLIYLGLMILCMVKLWDLESTAATCSIGLGFAIMHSLIGEGVWKSLGAL